MSEIKKHGQSQRQRPPGEKPPNLPLEGDRVKLHLDFLSLLTDLNERSSWVVRNKILPFITHMRVNTAEEDAFTVDIYPSEARGENKSFFTVSPENMREALDETQNATGARIDGHIHLGEAPKETEKQLKNKIKLMHKLEK